LEELKMVRRTVKKVLDGDTFITKRKIGNTNRVRLAGYNAPEKNQFGSSRATNRLRGLIGGKTVSIKPVGRSYGRVVGKVTINRRNVSKSMKR
jgi:micrococcal nuclease